MRQLIGLLLLASLLASPKGFVWGQSKFGSAGDTLTTAEKAAFREQADRFHQFTTPLLRDTIEAWYASHIGGRGAMYVCELAGDSSRDLRWLAVIMLRGNPQQRVILYLCQRAIVEKDPWVRGVLALTLMGHHDKRTILALSEFLTDSARISHEGESMGPLVASYFSENISPDPQLKTATPRERKESQRWMRSWYQKNEDKIYWDESKQRFCVKQ